MNGEVQKVFNYFTLVAFFFFLLFSSMRSYLELGEEGS